MRILIAEDNPMIQALNAELMGIWGYEFDMASNGVEAVEYAKKNNGKYDLCLMDVEMPKMNGIEATKIIRQETSYFPIMALTANHAYKEACYMVGMDDFTEKPCRPDNLFTKIARLTVKYIKVNFNEKHLLITKETPVSPQQAAVLKQLEEQKLSMISIFGTSTEAMFVVNEAVPKYIENEFTKNKRQSVMFLDHNPEGRGMCCLFSKTSMVIKKYMLDEEFDLENKNE
ncbi:MAG: response regulator, partial [Candidatus Polarisedimenticolaceae bacterium]|nr:response regulator [Candidatus Polarisedimenticolaceae bacterium]